MQEVILEVKHLSKAFGSNQVLRDIDFTVKKGDVTSIIGASGSGKSTLLRCINLLETPPPARSSTTAKTWPPRASTPPSTAPTWAWCSSPSICSTI